MVRSAPTLFPITNELCAGKPEPKKVASHCIPNQNLLPPRPCLCGTLDTLRFIVGGDACVAPFLSPVSARARLRDNRDGTIPSPFERNTISAHEQLIAENSASLQELRAFGAECSEADLQHPLAAGWTPAAVLAHIAFWDLRATALLAKWRQERIGPAPLDTDIINEATRVPFLAIPPQRALEVALSAGAAVNQAIVALSPTQVAEIQEEGTTLHLNRAEHRRMHIADIREQLGR